MRVRGFVGGGAADDCGAREVDDCRGLGIFVGHGWPSGDRRVYPRVVLGNRLIIKDFQEKSAKEWGTD